MGKHDKKTTEKKPNDTPLPLGQLFTKASALGSSVAEEEADLARYYVDADHLISNIRSGLPGLFLLVGPKGAGKSAVLRMLQESKHVFQQRLVTIRPADIALWNLANAPDLAGPIFEKVDRRWLSKTLWTYLFVVELLRQEYQDYASLWEKLKSMFSETRSRVNRLLEKGVTAGDSVSFSERFLEVVQELKVGGKLPAGAGVEIAYKGTAEKKAEASILNDLMAVNNRLDKLLHHDYVMLIDDLDQNWTGSEAHIELLETLITAIYSLSRTKRVSFVVALREDIMRHLKPEDPDKIRQRTNLLNWNQRGLKELVRSRISWATETEASTADHFPEVFADKSNLHVLWEVSGNNPRRLLQVLNDVIDAAKKKTLNRCDEKTLRDTCERLSVEFLNDLDAINRHWRPGLAFIARSFRVIPKQFDLDKLTMFCTDLSERLDKAKGEDKQAAWVQGYMGSPLTLAEEFLKIGLLHFKPGRESAAREYTNGDVVDEKTWYAVNPVYALGLGLA